MEFAGFSFIVFVIIVFVLTRCVRVCSEWQRKVVLSLGRFAGVRGPGLFLLFPWETTPYTVDMRLNTSSFTAEQTLTRDNVPVNVDTVVYWRVADPRKAVIDVADYNAAVMGAAQTALRDIIGRTNMNVRFFPIASDAR